MISFKKVKSSAWRRRGRLKQALFETNHIHFSDVK